MKKELLKPTYKMILSPRLSKSLLQLKIISILCGELSVTRPKSTTWWISITSFVYCFWEFLTSSIFSLILSIDSQCTILRSVEIWYVWMFSYRFPLCKCKINYNYNIYRLRAYCLFLPFSFDLCWQWVIQLNRSRVTQIWSSTFNKKPSSDKSPSTITPIPKISCR